MQGDFKKAPQFIRSADNFADIAAGFYTVYMQVFCFWKFAEKIFNLFINNIVMGYDGSDLL